MNSVTTAAIVDLIQLPFSTRTIPRRGDLLRDYYPPRSSQNFAQKSALAREWRFSDSTVPAWNPKGSSDPDSLAKSFFFHAPCKANSPAMFLVINARFHQLPPSFRFNEIPARRRIFPRARKSTAAINGHAEKQRVEFIVLPLKRQSMRGRGT